MSDAKQQLTPSAFRSLIDKLVIRTIKPEGISLDMLEDLRFQIDSYDKELIDIIKKRMDLVNAIGKHKKANNMTILQPDRWSEIQNRAMALGEQSNFSKDFVTKLFRTIHQEAINKQTQILNR
jgi:chorismate mutase